MREEWNLVLLPPNKDSLMGGYVTSITSARDRHRVPSRSGRGTIVMVFSPTDGERQQDRFSLLAGDPHVVGAGRKSCG